jgi:hypothetical protein
MEKLLGTTLTGIFWVTDNPNSKFKGALAIDETGSATLNVEGDPLELAALNARQTFHMHAHAEGKAVTLFDCFITYLEFLPNERKARIALNMVAVGALIDSPEVKVASVLSFTTPEIVLWTGLRGLTVKSSEKQVTVKYRGKRTRTAHIGDATLQFSTGIKHEETSRSEMNLVERHGVRIEFKEPQSVLAAEKWVTKTSRLLSVALRRSIPCRIYTLELENNGRVAVVTPWSEHKQIEANVRPLFTRQQMGAAYAKVLRSWFANYDNLEPVISLRVALLSQPAKYREFEFLTYVQALEALCRRTRPARTIVSKARFSTLRQKLVSAIPDTWQTKPEFVNRLAHLNEIALAARLEELFDDNDQLVRKLFSDAKKDIALIKTIRNYLTHYEGKTKKVIEAYKTTAKFTYLTWKVKLLLEIGILRAIGFSRTNVQKIIEQNSTYRDLCKVDHST